MRLSPVLSVECTVKGTQNKAYWDRTLRPSKKNPFPLAPADKVRAGEVTLISYEEQNKLLGEAVVQVMVPELTQMAKEPAFADGPRGIEILGAGLLRDLLWLIDAASLSFSPLGVTDSSSVACQNAEIFKTSHKINLGVCEASVEEAWENGFIDEDGTLAYYAGQFVQNQGKRAMNRLMARFGRFLKMPTPDGRLRRRVYLLHARGEDNPTERVEWKNTIPWRDNELCTPLEKGFGGPVAMETIATHWYWHQCYTMFRLSAPQPEGAKT